MNDVKPTIIEETLLASRYGTQFVAVVKRVDPHQDAGWNGDWAAYGPDYGTGNDVQRIRDGGSKLSERDARELFPQVEDVLPYRA